MDNYLLHTSCSMCYCCKVLTSLPSCAIIHQQPYLCMDSIGGFRQAGVIMDRLEGYRAMLWLYA